MRDLTTDPFGETAVHAHRRRYPVLGADMEFASNSVAVMRLVDAAFAALPAYRARSGSVPLRITLTLISGESPKRPAPPLPRLSSGAGLFCAHFDAGNFVIISPESGRALIQVSPALLRHPYHLRYEVIEFAALTLAARVRNLIPLHGASVGANGRGVLMIGDSGAGKSTLALACLLDGLDFLSEDSVFVTRDARLLGLANYVHVRPQGLRFVVDRGMRARIRGAPHIRRRSGVRKCEFDLRAAGLSLAARPFDLAATLVLSTRRGRDGALIEPMRRREFVAALRRNQPYAVGQPGWAEFERQAASRGGLRLLRGSSPGAGVRAIRELLDNGARGKHA